MILTQIAKTANLVAAVKLLMLLKRRCGGVIVARRVSVLLRVLNGITLMLMNLRGTLPHL